MNRQSAAIDVESPYCVHVSKDTFLQLHRLMRLFLPAVKAPSAFISCADAQHSLLSLLKLAKLNFERLSLAHVSPEDLGIVLTGDAPTLAPLYATLSEVCMCVTRRVV